eukprot:scaffold175910_cov22-Tisochrysis_lutea.AAC.2
MVLIQKSRTGVLLHAVDLKSAVLATYKYVSMKLHPMLVTADWPVFVKSAAWDVIMTWISLKGQSSSQKEAAGHTYCELELIGRVCSVVGIKRQCQGKSR